MAICDALQHIYEQSPIPDYHKDIGWAVIGILIFQIILALFLRPPLVRPGTLPGQIQYTGSIGDKRRPLLRQQSFGIARWAAI